MNSTKFKLGLRYKVVKIQCMALIYFEESSVSCLSMFGNSLLTFLIV